MGYIQLIEDGDARAFRAGEEGKAHAFRSEEEGELTSAFRKAVAEALVGGHVEALEGVERDMAREMAEQVGIRKDAGPEEGLMIAWYPPAEMAQSLAHLVVGTEGALAPEDIHLTLCHIKDLAGVDVTLVAAVIKIFAHWSGGVDCAVSGVGRFVGPEDSDVLIALVDSPYLAGMRCCLLDELCEHGVYLGEETHGFVPHFTLAYVPRSSPSSVTSRGEAYMFTVDSVSLVAGQQRADFGFAGGGVDEAVSSFEAYYEARKSAHRLEKINPQVELEGLAAAAEAGALDVADGPDVLAYGVSKSVDEARYTLGPLYAPERKDAHGEYTDAETLQTAVWDYVRQSAEQGRRLHLQHDEFGEVTVGEWVEVMAWPYDHTITLKRANGEEYEQAMPAGTVYFGVVWDEEAWPLVKTGKIGGYSLGGRAVRLQTEGDMAPMRAKTAAADVAEAHVYESAEDGMCKMCGLTKAAGNHAE